MFNKNEKELLKVSTLTSVFVNDGGVYIYCAPNGHKSF